MLLIIRTDHLHWKSFILQESIHGGTLSCFPWLNCVCVWGGGGGGAVYPCSLKRHNSQAVTSMLWHFMCETGEICYYFYLFLFLSYECVYARERACMCVCFISVSGAKFLPILALTANSVARNEFGLALT